MLKLLNWPNLRALSYDSLLILIYKLHCASKGDALKWPVVLKKRFKYPPPPPFHWTAIPLRFEIFGQNDTNRSRNGKGAVEAPRL